MSKNKTYSAVSKNNTTDPLFVKGQNIFKKECTSCHSIDMVLLGTAPPLGGVTKKREKKWLYNYTRNSYKMYSQGDKIAKEIRSTGNSGLMTSFPYLSDSDLDAVYYFVEKKFEMTKKGIAAKK